MSKAVWLISFKLKADASVEDFLIASEKVHNEVLSKQPGFIDWKVLRNKEVWVDLITWETMEYAKKGEKAGAGNPLAKDFYSYMDYKSIKMQRFFLEKDY